VSCCPRRKDSRTRAFANSVKPITNLPVISFLSHNVGRKSEKGSSEQHNTMEKLGECGRSGDGLRQQVGPAPVCCLQNLQADTHAENKRTRIGSGDGRRTLARLKGELLVQAKEGSEEEWEGKGASERKKARTKGRKGREQRKGRNMEEGMERERASGGRRERERASRKGGRKCSNPEMVVVK
jgi:hypothetical protein